VPVLTATLIQASRNAAARELATLNAGPPEDPDGIATRDSYRATYLPTAVFLHNQFVYAEMTHYAQTPDGFHTPMMFLYATAHLPTQYLTFGAPTATPSSSRTP
jgi:hypothetical protein